jgi:hypothetical protein
MRKKPKIFIASSQRALNLAKAFKDKLDTEYSEATIGSEVKKGKRVFPEKLMQAAKEDFDFALIILTLDDLVFEAGGNQGLREGTYNCIFEAGLFAGTLGVGRCFLVCGFGYYNLPSDLQIYDHYNMKLPEDLEDFETCRKSIDDSPVIDDILQIIQEKGRFTERLKVKFVRFNDLLARQKLKSKNGELHEGCQVVYLMNQPFVGTKQLTQNMPKVRYYYFLPADIFNTERIVAFLQKLLVKNIGDQQVAHELFSHIRELLTQEENQRKFLKNLESIVKNNCLNFCFFPVESTFQFVIHNAGTDDAKMYIKYGDYGFLEWMKGRVADYFARSLLDLRIQPVKEGIFHSTLFFNVHDDTAEQTRRFRASLDCELRRYFPNIHEQVKQLCFEGKLEKKGGRSVCSQGKDKE